MILDESKGQTVRAHRRGRSRHARVGETVYLYYGMRTKFCRKLGEGICTAVVDIEINALGQVWLDGKLLTDEDRDLFAFDDGFRPAGTSLLDPAGAFTHMLLFWRTHNELPFSGVVIFWDPTKGKGEQGSKKRHKRGPVGTHKIDH